MTTVEGKSDSKVGKAVVECKAAPGVGAEPVDKDTVEVQPVYKVESKSDSKITTAVVEGKAAQRVGAEPAESAGCLARVCSASTLQVASWSAMKAFRH